MKLIQGYPNEDKANWLSAAYLVRGSSPDRGYARKGWTYMNEVNVKELLGYPLSRMYPSISLAEVNSTDEGLSASNG